MGPPGPLAEKCSTRRRPGRTDPTCFDQANRASSGCEPRSRATARRAARILVRGVGTNNFPCSYFSARQHPWRGPSQVLLPEKGTYPGSNGPDWSKHRRAAHEPSLARTPGVWPTSDHHRRGCVRHELNANSRILRNVLTKRVAQQRAAQKRDADRLDASPAIRAGEASRFCFPGQHR
jgi:hypothetical protein